MGSHNASSSSHFCVTSTLCGWLLMASCVDLSTAWLPCNTNSVSTGLLITKSSQSSTNSLRIRSIGGNDLNQIFQSKTVTTTTTSLQASAKTMTRTTTKQRKRKTTARKRKSAFKKRGVEELEYSASDLHNGGSCENVMIPQGSDNKANIDAYTKYVRRLNNSPALALNADYQPLGYMPLSLWSWQDAVKAVFSGKVTVVDVYPDLFIRAPNMMEIPVPSVIALNEYVPVSNANKRPAFTRRNVFIRDEYKCQYCSQQFKTCDLSLDHVHPRCMGGILSWENAVTSCVKCNGRKGSLTTNQLRAVGMKLTRKPVVPSQFELASRAAKMVARQNRHLHPTWLPYLQLMTTPEEEDDIYES